MDELARAVAQDLNLVSEVALSVAVFNTAVNIITLFVLTHLWRMHHRPKEYGFSGGLDEADRIWMSKEIMRCIRAAVREAQDIQDEDDEYNGIIPVQVAQGN